MARIDIDMDELKELVRKLLSASEGDQKKILKKVGKNDLADLHEEMHGKPNTPMVEDDELTEDDDEAEEMPVKKGQK